MAPRLRLDDGNGKGRSAFAAGVAGRYFCSTPAIAVDKLDTMVPTALADKVLTPERSKAMLVEPKPQVASTKGRQDETLRTMQKELTDLEAAIMRLFEAVGKGVLPMDDMLGGRVKTLKARGEGVLGEIARSKRAEETPLSRLSTAQVTAFASAMRTRLLDRSSAFPKQYLRALVSDIAFRGAHGAHAGPQGRGPCGRGGRKNGHHACGAHFRPCLARRTGRNWALVGHACAPRPMTTCGKGATGSTVRHTRRRPSLLLAP